MWERGRNVRGVYDSRVNGCTDALGIIVYFIQERFKEQKKLKKIAKTAWLRT